MGKRSKNRDYYYPFGLTIASDAGGLTTGQPYKFGTKELEKSFGLELYDFGARMQDPQLGRWFALDYLAEKYYAISAYSYCANNPIIYKDKSGKYIEGIDNKPVFFERKNGNIVWSPNASIDVQRVGNQMLTTKAGTEIFTDMQKTSYPIGMILDYLSITPGVIGSTKQTWNEEETKIERMDISYFMGEILDIASKKIPDENLSDRAKAMVDNDFTVDEILGANGAHEGVHATNQENIKNVKAAHDGAKDVETEKPAEDKEREHINEKIKQKNEK